MQLHKTYFGFSIIICSSLDNLKALSISMFSLCSTYVGTYHTQIGYGIDIRGKKSLLGARRSAGRLEMISH